MNPVSTVSVASAGGGLVTGSLQSSVRVDGNLIAVNGSPIASHGSNPHNTAVTANGVAGCRINGIPINTDGNIVSCGHVLVNGVAAFRIE